MSLTQKFPLNHSKSETLWKYIQDITEVSTNKSETEILKQIVDISSHPSVVVPQPPPPPPAPAPVPEKPKYNIPNVPSPITSLNLKSGTNSIPSVTPYNKSRSKTKSSGKRSNSSRDSSKNLASLNNYFVGSDLAALFGSAKYPGINLDPATKSLLNLNSFSLGGMFLPPMAAAAAAAAAASYKPDPSVGLMKPPPPPPSSNSYFNYTQPRTTSGSRSGSSSTRHTNKSIPSTSRDVHSPSNKVPKLDAHQMANFFIPTSLSKNCSVTNRVSNSSSNK